MNNVIQRLQGIDAIISEVKAYKYTIEAKKSFSFAVWTSRQIVILRIQAEGKSGWGEEILAVNQPEIDLQEWANELGKLKGKSLSEGLNYVRNHIGIWESRCSEIAEMALIDLAGKLTQQSALALLGLKEQTPLYGVYVILSDDPKEVEEKAKWAMTNQKDHFIKVKLFGDPLVDEAIIEAVRKNVNPETFLIGDVNGGYGMPREDYSLEEIAQHLNQLHKKGLNACEDPAYITHQEWVTLQSKVGTLSLIPDYPMRPASQAKDVLLEGMGRIYNIHPGCTASIIDTLDLAKRIHETGAKLMIGDDSLVGPGCNIWQQLAIGLGADWVEAIEKDKESDFYFEAVQSVGAAVGEDQLIRLKENVAGFGIALDDEKLMQAAVDVVIY